MSASCPVTYRRTKYQFLTIVVINRVRVRVMVRDRYLPLI